MTSQDSKSKVGLHSSIRRLLMEWDPIGIAQFPEAHDEYDGYIPDIEEMLRRKAKFAELFDFLWWVETEHMGLPGNREQTKRCVEQLMRLVNEPTAEDA